MKILERFEVLFYLLGGILFIWLGGLLLNSNPPNAQTAGFPLIVIGFAFFVFSQNSYNALKSEKKNDEIMKKLESIRNELKRKE